MKLDTTGRIAIGSLLLGAVGVAILIGLGHARLALPAAGGVVWGVVNMLLLRRVVRHLRPEGVGAPGRLALEIGLKFPLMYALAFVLLRSRPVDEIVAAAAGFTMVLVVTMLRALGWLLTHTSDEPDRRSAA